MTFKSIISSVLLLTLLAACGAAPAAPLAPPTLTSTSVSASAGPIPAATALAASAPTTPELTPLFQPGSTPDMPVPEPSVDITAGPWLIVSNARGLQSFSADGTLAQTFDRAQLSLGRQLEGGIAPTGGSVAFIGGDNPMTPDREGSGPLTLNLLNVVDGTFKPVTPLFVPEMEEAIRSAILTGDRTDAVEAGIAVAENSDTLAWSPDGRYLAFIAAIDGPSSDVYSYDRESGTINRLTDGPHQAARLFWSPDSQWIIHEEVENFGTGAGWNVKAVWAAAPDGSGTRKLYDTEWSGDEVFVDWIAPDAFIVYSWSPLGLQDARVFNLSKDEAQRIGPEFPVQAYAVEPSAQTQLYSVDDYTARENNLRSGVYFDSPSQQPQLTAPGNWYDVRWLPQAQMFLAKGESGVISVALDGTTKQLSGEGALPIDSPDGAWLIATGDGNFTGPIGLRLYTTDGELKRAITPEAVTYASWSPDSSSVLYASDGKLYYVAIPNGEPQLIEENLASTTSGSLGWVMP